MYAEYMTEVAGEWTTLILKYNIVFRPSFYICPERFVLSNHLKAFCDNILSVMKK